MKRIAFLAATLLLSFLCHAQDELIFQRNFDGESEGVSRGPFEHLQVVNAPPQSGTFWSLQLTNFPPWPVNPFPELPVYSWGNAYIFDDWDVDWVAVKKQHFPLFGFANTSSENGGMQLMAEDGPPFPGEGGGGGGTNVYESDPIPPSYDVTNDLWLEITSVTNAAAYFVIHTPATNEMYDLFNTTNLLADVPGLNLTNWLWLARSAAGQTNLIETNLPPSRVLSFYRLGTMQDSDADGLTDAYEQLVSHTNPNDPDTDGDGLSDYYELLNGLSPLASQGIPSLGFVSVPTCPVP